MFFFLLITGIEYMMMKLLVILVMEAVVEKIP